jgi:uncharacterized protein YceH (UPF0502 family)
MQQPDRLARIVRALLLGERARPDAPGVPHADAPARLEAVEREVAEVRTRVNALFFAVITASVADLVARMVLR